MLLTPADKLHFFKKESTGDVSTAASPHPVFVYSDEFPIANSFATSSVWPSLVAESALPEPHFKIEEEQGTQFYTPTLEVSPRGAKR